MDVFFGLVMIFLCVWLVLFLMCSELAGFVSAYGVTDTCVSQGPAVGFDALSKE